MGEIIMVKRFTVSGEPKGKGRPRYVSNENYKNVYTPKDTAEYERLVAAEYIKQCGNSGFNEGEMLKMQVLAYFAIPKSTSKKKRALMLSGAIRPTKRPDMDNIVKIIADSLNKLAYHDDAQIVSADVRKYYSDKPRVEVTIENVQERNK